jgi:hypothetical protein
MRELSVKVKLSPYWHLGFQEVEAPRQSAHEGGKVVSSTHRPPLPPSQGNIPGISHC